MAGSDKSRILVFGGTGYIGKYIVRASVSMGHETYVYGRPLTPESAPSKVALHEEFKALGVTIVEGHLDDKEKLESAVKKVDVVISALAYPQTLDQLKIVDAMKAAPNIKRFVPSDFGAEEDRVSTPLRPFQVVLEKKRQVRRAAEAAGIPHTFISANLLAAYFINYLLVGPNGEAREDTSVYGPGDVKAVLNYEEDVGVYTVKAALDPRTLNRVVIYRPPKNVVTQLEIISLWEKKTGRTYNRTHVLGEQLVQLSKTLPEPDNIPVSILYSVFVKGETANFELADELEASELFPDHRYTSVDELLDIFLVNPPKGASAAFG